MFRIARIVTFIIAIALLVPANVSAETQTNILSVSGNGTLKVSPDIAYLSVGVRTTDKDAEAASARNNEITGAVVNALKSAGIDEKDVKTQYYYVNPMYDYSTFDKGENSITGYEVSNSLNITIRKIDDAGKIIDVCISAGANMINGLNYSVETPSNYYDKLFERAIADASKKSSAISKALGITLTAPVSIAEGGYVNAASSYVNLNMGMKDAGAAASLSSTYTSPGDIDLYSSVVLTYEYK